MHKLVLLSRADTQLVAPSFFRRAASSMNGRSGWARAPSIKCDCNQLIGFQKTGDTN
jgi:hypothetical protein